MAGGTSMSGTAGTSSAMKKDEEKEPPKGL
jgi:hypothetical protein